MQEASSKNWTGNMDATAQAKQLVPELPQVPPGLTEPKDTYKRGVWVAVAALGGFLLLYFGLTAFFLWTAYSAVTHIRHSFSPLIEIFAGGVSLILAVFLVKALFAVRPGMVTLKNEITRESEPKLFAFLDELARLTRAPRPHRVFLSTDVNAAVFYDLSLKEILRPSKKNLVVGLPLVNALSLSELTAVLAHEFGHFSQSSMAVGQWVYTARQVAGHLIATRDWLDGGLTRLSRTDLRVAWIGWLLQLVIWSIRSLLDLGFRGVVLAERALGREMEFHADLVAVSVTGSEAIVHALARLHAADDMWDEAIAIAASQAEKGLLVPDLFELQTQALARMKEVTCDPTFGSPAPATGPDRSAHRVFTRGIAEPPRMWSSHPSSVDREENAKKVFIPASADERTSWALFHDPVGLRARVTSELIAAFPKPESARLLSPAEALNAVDERYSARWMHPQYRGLYLGRTITREVVEPSQLWTPPAQTAARSSQDLYGPELAQLYAAFRAKVSERNSLEAIHYGQAVAPGGVIQVAGQVVRRRKLPQMIGELTREAQDLWKQLLHADAMHRQLHLNWAESVGTGWDEYLKSLLRLMHFAGHQLANLQDACDHYNNVLDIVTADKKVSKREGKRLLKAAMEVYLALAQIYAVHSQVELPAPVQATFHGKPWQELLPAEYSLPAPTLDSLNEWIHQMGDWVEVTSNALAAVERRTLSVLLDTEEQIRKARDASAPLGAAPRPARAPESYQSFSSDKKRPRQYRLDLWDRFVLAQGFGPSVLRFVVAASVLSSVVSMAGEIGRARVVAFNGLLEPVTVQIGSEKATLEPGASAKLDISVAPKIDVSALAESGFRESFHINAEKGDGHYVYNVGGAKALMRHDVVYGQGAPRAPEYLGHKRWLNVIADYYFESPPEQVKLKGKGSVKRVLSALAPEEELSILGTASGPSGVTDASSVPEPTLLEDASPKRSEP